MTTLLSTTELTSTELTSTELTAAELTTAELTATAGKGWHPDPSGRHDLRYHDGRTWTGHVTHFGPVPCLGCRDGH